jgi:Zn-dependent metalloprotease
MEPGRSSWCSIVPEYLLREVAENKEASSEVRTAAEKTIEEGRDLFTRSTIDSGMVGEIAGKTIPVTFDGKPPPALRLERFIWTANGNKTLPGTICLEDQPYTTQFDEVKAVYHRLKHIYDFFYLVFNWRLFDNNGNQLHVSINYGHNCMNEYWNGSQIILGQGSPAGLTRFYTADDVLAHELTHGIISQTSGLNYRDETGALSEHLADVFAVLYKQRRSRENEASEASWVIGERLFPEGNRSHKVKPQYSADGYPTDEWVIPGAKGADCYLNPKRTAWNTYWAPAYLRSLAEPKSTSPPQVVRYSKYEKLKYDNGGVHHNSGIPNFAFYTAAIEARGAAWAGVGKVWFRAMTDPKLRSDSSFADFAALTISWAERERESIHI